MVARVERNEDLVPVERILVAIKDVAGVRLDWSIYQQALGFGREFGFTNRHLMGVVVTNGLLARLVGTNVVVPKASVGLPPGLAFGATLDEAFFPRRVISESPTNSSWLPVELTVAGWAWVTNRFGLGKSDSMISRAWIGPERDRFDGRWDNDARELIREFTFDRICKRKLRPRLETFLAEFTARDPVLFPSVDDLMEVLVAPRSFPFQCPDCPNIDQLLKEPIAR